MEENKFEIGLDEDLQERLNQIQNVVLPGSGESTDTTIQPEQTAEPSTGGQQEYIAPGEEGFVPREGALGFVQDVTEGTIRGLPQTYGKV